jgi:hypothetical protein
MPKPAHHSLENQLRQMKTNKRLGALNSAAGQQVMPAADRREEARSEEGSQT